MEIRRSYNRLISTMGFPILVRRHLYIESGSRFKGSLGICWWISRWWRRCQYSVCDVAVVFGTVRRLPSSQAGVNQFYHKLPHLPTRGIDYEVKCMLKCMLVYKDFLTWLLIGCGLCCQPIKCEFWKSFWTKLDFIIMIMEIIFNPYVT